MTNWMRNTTGIWLAVGKVVHDLFHLENRQFSPLLQTRDRLVQLVLAVDQKPAGTVTAAAAPR